MIRLFITFVVIFCVDSCSRDCSRNIDKMDIFPVINTSTSEPSTIKEWYHSEFQTKKLNFTLEFSILGGGEMCNYFWENYPIDSSLSISCSNAISVSNSIIPAKSNLKNYFTINKFENDKEKDLTYLLSADIDKNNIQFKDTIYSFYVCLKTNDNKILKDSCIVKYYNK